MSIRFRFASSAPNIPGQPRSTIRRERPTLTTQKLVERQPTFTIVGAALRESRSPGTASKLSCPDPAREPLRLFFSVFLLSPPPPPCVRYFFFLPPSLPPPPP